MANITTLLPVAIFIGLVFFLHRLARQKIKFSKRIFISLALGICFGIGLQTVVGGPENDTVIVTDHVLSLVGDGYLALLKMLIVPLILTSITYSIVNINDVMAGLLKKLASASITLLLMMTALASAIGMWVASLFHLGQGLQLPMAWKPASQSYTGIVDTILGMIPSNPIEAMSSENTVAIVIFAVLLGISALILAREDESKVAAFRNVIESTFHVVKKLTSLVLLLTPYGILALMAHATATQGMTALFAIVNYIVAIYVAMILVIAMHMLILTFRGVSPWFYLRNAMAPLLVAFTTRSSFATLAVSEETLQRKFQVSQMTATFVPSMGATLGMNACAGVFPAVLVVMAMNILHMPITTTAVLSVMFINMVASLGISGIPGTAYIAATVSLTALGLPYAVVGLVQGVDPLVDMGRTATNVSGALTTAIVVDKGLPQIQEIETVG